VVDEHENMVGVDSWGSIPGYEHVARMNGGGLPFVDVPGTRMPKDGSRDKMLMRKLADAGVPLRKGTKLDYDQSKALYENVRSYFDDTDPLMNTERWMASFVEDRGMTYTDHDGRHYLMKDCKRKLIDEDGDEDEFFDRGDAEDDEEGEEVRIV
jgi:hypothetical protein